MAEVILDQDVLDVVDVEQAAAETASQLTNLTFSCV